jgi:phosphoribosyl 1,2-cyclic phosphodiesterase
MHLAYRQLAEKLPLIRPKRLIITHMSEAMLSRNDIASERAYDGLIVKI